MAPKDRPETAEAVLALLHKAGITSAEVVPHTESPTCRVPLTRRESLAHPLPANNLKADAAIPVTAFVTFSWGFDALFVLLPLVSPVPVDEQLLAKFNYYSLYPVSVHHQLGADPNRLVLKFTHTYTSPGVSDEVLHDAVAMAPSVVIMLERFLECELTPGEFIPTYVWPKFR